MKIKVENIYGDQRKGLEKITRVKRQFLSIVGREILVKAIAHTIPSHGICCFKLLATIFDEINSPINKFWWDEKKDERKIH